MLRKDATAAFARTGAAFFARYRFQAGGLEASKDLGGGSYARLLRQQRETPVLMLRDEARGRAWWMFRDAFYAEDEGLTALEVKALLLERETLRGRRVQRAVALMEQQTAPAVTGRDAIPDAVKLFVWQRDGGRCVGCGSRTQLEFDHVIPLALGGANTARNLQLLCTQCNRRKGASVV